MSYHSRREARRERRRHKIDSGGGFWNGVGSFFEGMGEFLSIFRFLD